MLLIFFKLLNGPFGENVFLTPSYLFYILQMNLTVHYCGKFKLNN